jgi:isoamylase
VTKQLAVGPGRPYPLGTLRGEVVTNFALMVDPRVVRVTLCLFQPYVGQPLKEIELDPEQNRTGNVWHLALSNLPEHVQYAYRLEGPLDPERSLFFSSDRLVIDPYARAVRGHLRWGERGPHYAARGVCDADVPLDWEEDRPLRTPPQDLIIYEMHIRGFTMDESAQVAHPGSFLGVIEKIPYLKALGINAVELMPAFEFDECSYLKKAPQSGKQLYNYWGYMPLNYFAPMSRFSSRPGADRQPLRAIGEFKAMVQELHRAGIAVILDVVYNHTGETDPYGPSVSFLGLAPHTYYLLDRDQKFLNYSGCGNTLNGNHPVVRDLIVDSLRYWVTEMHVDGFRFDLASTLTRAQDGAPLANPPVVEAISLDPVLAETLLISESWDAAGLYQVGGFPYLGRWSEWNGKFRDTVRRFIKGDREVIGAFAGALCGSEELYGYTGLPTASVNFITAHDGFTLRDLVSYNEKHNLDNGEDNRDGTNDNASWNCGVEGETANRTVEALRCRQMRNLHLALMLSNGIPMLLMGDEYGHTRGGNNNAWCHDDRLNWFIWDHDLQDRAYFRFYKGLIHFRRDHPVLRKGRFFTAEDITFHGPKPEKPNWAAESHFIAFTLHDEEQGEDLYAAFNAQNDRVAVTIPPAREGFAWRRVVDTAAIPPRDFLTARLVSKSFAPASYTALPYSAILLQALPKSR